MNSPNNSSSLNDDDSIPLSTTNLNSLSREFLTPLNTASNSDLNLNPNAQPTFIYTPPTIQVLSADPNHLSSATPNTQTLQLPPIPKTHIDPITSDSSRSSIQSDSTQNTVSTGFSFVTPKLRRLQTLKPISKPRHISFIQRLSIKLNSSKSGFIQKLSTLFYSDRSLLLFSPNSSIRQLCQNITRSPFFNKAINLLVLIDWILIILKNHFHHDVQDKMEDKIQGYVISLLIILNSFFIIEILLQSISNGLFFEYHSNDKKQSTFIDQKILNEFNENNNSVGSNQFNSNNLPYLRKSIHRLDFLGTLMFWILEIVIWTKRVDINGPTVMVLQFLSAIRPVRLLFQVPFFDQIIRTLKLSLPLMKNVTLFIIFFFIVMSHLGLILFQGTLNNRCFMKDESGNYIPSEIFCYRGKYVDEYPNSFYSPRGYICPKNMECLVYENKNDGEYKYQYGILTFDNFLSSSLIVFITITNQLYSDIMYHTMATNGWWSSAYFCIVVIMFSFWLIELYIAVIGRIFEKIREEDELNSSKMKKSQLSNNQIEVSWKKFLGWEVQQDIEQIPLQHFNTITGTYELVQLNQTIANPVKSLRSTSGLPGLLPKKLYKILVLLLPIMESISFALVWLDLILRIADQVHDGWSTNLFFYTNWFLFLTLIVRFLVKKCPYPPRMVQRLTITDYVDALLILIPIALNLYFWITANTVTVYLEVFSIFRVYRVLDIIPGVGQIMSKLSENVISTVRVLTFIWALLLLVAPMFMQILAYRLSVPSYLEDNQNNIMRYDTIQQSVLSLIQLLDGEDWPNQLYEMAYKFTDPSTIAIMTFMLIVWSFLSNFILARMFIAVAMEGFELVRGEKYQIQLNNFLKNIQGVKQREQSYPISIWNPYRLLPSKPLPLSIPHLPSYLKFRLPTHLTSYLMDPPKNQNPKFTPRDYYRSRFYNDHPNYSRTIFLFRPNNPIRNFCEKLSDRSFSLWKNILNFKDIRLYYQLIIWFAIIGSTVVGGLNSPKIRHEYWMNREGKGYLYWKLNLAFTTIMTIEFLIILIARGFLFTPKGYLRGFWNRIDLMVLILQIVDVILTNDFDVTVSRVFHVLVSLRALRLVTRTRTLKRTLYSIFVAGFFKLLTVLLILIAFIVPFAVLGKVVFGGRLAMCNQDTENIIIMRDCVGNYISDDGKGILMPRTWANPYMYSFDTLGSSLMILIEIASREKWIDVMRDTMNIVGPGYQPRDEASWWNSTFFVAYCFGVQLIGISTFIAVIINNHREFTGTAEISEDEKNWIDLKKQLDQVKPSKKMVNCPTDLGLKQWCFKTATNKKSWWNRLCSLVYLSIFFLIMLGYLNMSETWRLIRLWGLVTCLTIAGINEIIQMYGRGVKVYFSKPLNPIFLVIIVVAFSIQVSLYLVNIKDYHLYEYWEIMAKKIGFCLTLFVGLKLIVKLDPLLQLIYILKASLIDILQLAYVWFIIFVIYAIAMNQGFGDTKWGKNMSYYVNANDYYAIFLLLFRISTGEGWNDIMYDFKVQSPNCYVDKDLRSDCGNPWLATALFVSFHAISVYIFASMFVIFLLDTFSYCYEIFASFSFISRQDLREFKKNWSKLDPTGVGFIHRPDLIKLLKGLETPFKIRPYPVKFNHVNLCKEYNRKYKEKFGSPAWQRGTPANQLSRHAIKDYCKWLQRQLDLLDTEKLKERKVLFNLIHIDCSQHILHSKGKGLQFNHFLKLVVQYKLIDPLKCFLLKEIIPYQKHQDQIRESYNRQKILGLFKNYLKQWRARRELRNQTKHQIPQISLGGLVIQSDDSSDESDVERPVPISRDQPKLRLEIPKATNYQSRDFHSIGSPTSSSPDHSPMSFYEGDSPLSDVFDFEQLSAGESMQLSLLHYGHSQWDGNITMNTNNSYYDY